MDTWSPTRLPEADLARLRAQAQPGPFVDPAMLARVQAFVSGRHEWAAAVTGRTGFDVRSMSHRELVLLDRAAAAEPDPPRRPRALAPWDPGYQRSPRERAAIEKQRAAEQAWRELRAALPVPVTVLHNYTSARHTESAVQGVEHIILDADLHIRRLHRTAGRPLCFIPSKAHDLVVFDNPGDGPHGRMPTCRACLRTAYRLTGLTPALLETR